jgi:hypothetical protein
MRRAVILLRADRRKLVDTMPWPAEEAGAGAYRPEYTSPSDLLSRAERLLRT